MQRIALALLVAGALLAKNPPSGKAADARVGIAAVFLDAAATKAATGSDFDNTYTVIHVTVTPQGDQPLAVSPDDFLLRINSNSDSSGPMSAAQIYGAGGGLILHSSKETIGITPANAGYNGVTVAPPSNVDTDEIKALRAKMLTAKTTTATVSGLLFFPIAKKGHRDLDLVYTSPVSKLHIEFR